ncbi:non-capsid protein NS-1 [Trichonephila clavata]|uniref:Non-capsid protein NS-1 n=1 Tax=Trichonephila clavata TaxID=2740835 RepID=A0A8X6LIE9_TRICU|nr:non-capsid protein NS-1 [Trichonephila clavata]
MEFKDNEYKLNSKINTIAVIGPPNAGKNYFWDCLAAIALNVGHIGRVNNKTNQFALQEVIDKRLIIGNEINMEDGAKDDFKKLCEGKALNIRVKHCPTVFTTEHLSYYCLTTIWTFAMIPLFGMLD